MTTLAMQNMNDASRAVVQNTCYLNERKELIDINSQAPKLKLAEACVLNRNLFWATTKSYPRASINEIVNIIKAQSNTLPPFEGEFFWRLRNLSEAQFMIDYFVVPKDVFSLIPSHCRFLIPLYDAEKEVVRQPLSLSVEQDNQQAIMSAKLSWLDLVGLHIRRKKAKASQRLSTRNLMLCLAAVASVTAVSMSTYIYWAKHQIDSAQQLNKSQVDDTIAKRQEYNLKVSSINGLQEFLQQNPNVLGKLAALNLNPEGVVLERVSAIPRGVEIRGVTQGNATDLLKQVVGASVTKEAKFTGPVIKQKTGGEAFTIEVVWL